MKKLKAPLFDKLSCRNLHVQTQLWTVQNVMQLRANTCAVMTLQF